MALKPWYNIVTPREDLVEGRPLDASEFAVHLDHIRLKKAPADYLNPERFFSRTYMTQNLLELSVQTVKRLSGITTETSPVFNLTTQFGGGKTHALALLYHLANSGPKAKKYQGVDKILSKAQITNIPSAKIGIFVGTEFSSVSGRGEQGEPIRKTPWGEIAFQIAGNKGFGLFKELDDKYIPPAGDDLNKLFDVDQPYLLLFDELLNYVSKHRNFHELSAQFYNFLQTLTEFVRSRDNIVLAVSIPASEMEMNVEDQADFDRFKKLLDRLGKAMFMSAEKESTEIIRRRLFEWHGLPDEARKTIAEYVNWIQEHRSQIPDTFNVDTAREQFEASYPFHPQLISLFERKWQSLQRFQQTRGILRLLALWVSKAYNDGFKKVLKEPIISLGTAPLEDQNFRSAVFEQMGENKLEVAVTTDIIGKDDSHAIRLDSEAIEGIKKARLHRKCATIIFFESNGGQSSDKLATVPEIKLSISEPDLDIGLLDSVIQSLLDSCYYLTSINNKYKFSTQENLIKRFSDRKAGIQLNTINDFIEQEIKKVFDKGTGIDKIIFPEKSNQISDKPVLTFTVIHPKYQIKDKETKKLIEELIKNYGQSARTYKSGLIFVVADNDVGLKDDARKFLAWETINEELDELNIDEHQRSQVKASLAKAKKDIAEKVWVSYNQLVLLDKDNKLQTIDLGLIHSSQARSIIDHYINHLVSLSEITDEVNPNFLIRNWPPAFKEWSTKNVRDVFYASPIFPRLLKPDSIKVTIAKGVANGFIAYIGKHGNKYEPFYFEQNISPNEIEISDEIYIVTAGEARKHIEPRRLALLKILPSECTIEPKKSYSFVAKGYDQHNDEINLKSIEWQVNDGQITKNGKYTASNTEGKYQIYAKSQDIIGSSTVTVAKEIIVQPVNIESEEVKTKKISWSGQVQPNKWTVFYTKILAKFAKNPNLKINISFELEDKDIPEQKIEEIKTALKELGLDDKIL